jgi:hypothetical protein
MAAFSIFRRCGFRHVRGDIVAQLHHPNHRRDSDASPARASAQPDASARSSASVFTQQGWALLLLSAFGALTQACALGMTEEGPQKPTSQMFIFGCKFTSNLHWGLKMCLGSASSMMDDATRARCYRLTDLEMLVFLRDQSRS